MLPSIAHRTTNPGHATATITTTRTLTSDSSEFQVLTASGGNVNVDLPALANSYGLKFTIKNAGGSNSLIVRNAAAATIATVTPGLSVQLVCDGLTWKAMSLAGSGLLADGSVAGATGAAQDFGTNGVKADVLAGSTATTGTFGVSAADNQADAFSLQEGSNKFLTVDTRNGAEQLTAGKFIQKIGAQRVTTTKTYTSDTTLSTPTGMTAVSLLAGKVYRVRGCLYITATVNGGLKTALTAATLTATSFIGAIQYWNGGTAGTAAQVTSLGAFSGATEVVTRAEFSGLLVVNAAGTLALQTAQNASHSDTTSILAGSWIEYELVA